MLFVIALAICICLFAGACTTPSSGMAVPASTDYDKPIDIVFTDPLQASADTGAATIKRLFPDISQDIKFGYSISSSDKSKEKLVYQGKKAVFRYNINTDTVDMLILSGVLDTKTANISIEDAKAIAVSCVNKYRPDFLLDNMELETAKFQSEGKYGRYHIEWKEIKDGVDIGKRITIELNGNGDFISYSVIKRYDSDIATNTKRMPVDQAIQIAKEYLSSKVKQELFDRLKTKDSYLMIGNNSRVCWLIEFSSQLEMIRSSIITS